MKKINEMAKSVLIEAYTEFDEKSKSLVVNVNPDAFSQKANISIENLYLCLWYLEDKKLIREKTIYSNNLSEETQIEIVLTADGIDLVESMI